jgi:hypothetical protein
LKPLNLYHLYELNSELKGEVNVASVDVPANRDIGTRFAIKGSHSNISLLLSLLYEYSL